ARRRPMMKVLLAATGFTMIIVGATMTIRELRAGRVRISSPFTFRGSNRRALRPHPKQVVMLVSALTSVIALSLTAAGVTFALMSATRTQASANTFTEGTVSFQTTTGVTCAANSGITPSSTLTTCQLAVTYNGTASGYVGLDILIITAPGVGGTALYTANSG